MIRNQKEKKLELRPLRHMSIAGMTHAAMIMGMIAAVVRRHRDTQRVNSQRRQNETSKVGAPE